MKYIDSLIHFNMYQSNFFLKMYAINIIKWHIKLYVYNTFFYNRNYFIVYDTS